MHFRDVTRFTGIRIPHHDDGQRLFFTAYAAMNSIPLLMKCSQTNLKDRERVESLRIPPFDSVHGRLETGPC